MQERRTSQRLRTNLNARWETLKMQGRGTVCDLSSTGCFVLTNGEVTLGDLVRLELIHGHGVLTLWGSIVYQIPEMGFAIRFAFENNSDRQSLDKLISHSPE